MVYILSDKKESGQKDYENYCNTFFVKYEENGIDKAVDYIFSTNPQINKDDSQIVNLKTELHEAAKLLGEYNGYGLIATKSIANSYIYCSYLIKYSRQPLRFSFIFYKPKDKWVLHKFTFDNELEKELETAGTIYFLTN